MKYSNTWATRLFCSLFNPFFFIFHSLESISSASFFSFSQYVNSQVLNHSAKLSANISSALYSLTQNNSELSLKTLSYKSTSLLFTNILNTPWNISWGGVLSLTISVKYNIPFQYAHRALTQAINSVLCMNSIGNQYQFAKSSAVLSFVNICTLRASVIGISAWSEYCQIRRIHTGSVAHSGVIAHLILSYVSCLTSFEILFKASSALSFR